MHRERVAGHRGGCAMAAEGDTKLERFDALFANPTLDGMLLTSTKDNEPCYP